MACKKSINKLHVYSEVLRIQHLPILDQLNRIQFFQRLFLDLKGYEAFA
jgi:hypothetical protein